MRQVRFDPKSLPDPEKKQWWDDWEGRANAKRDDYVDRFGRGVAVTFDNSVWTELKTWIIRHVFSGKCAYCENEILPGSYGDAEHFRPKSRVRVLNENKKRIEVGIPGGGYHPGYYWLAYHWRNLLPACTRCNGAKSDEFPVACTHVHVAAPEPEELDKVERPLVINPYVDDPAEYLVFGVDGSIAAIGGNARGKATIAVFKLDREDLIRARSARQRSSLRVLGSMINDVLGGKLVTEDEENEWLGPRAAYSMAVEAIFAEMMRPIWERFGRYAGGQRASPPAPVTNSE